MRSITSVTLILWVSTQTHSFASELQQCCTNCNSNTVFAGQTYVSSTPFSCPNGCSFTIGVKNNDGVSDFNIFVMDQQNYNIFTAGQAGWVVYQSLSGRVTNACGGVAQDTISTSGTYYVVFVCNFAPGYYCSAYYNFDIRQLTNPNPPPSTNPPPNNPPPDYVPPPVPTYDAQCGSQCSTSSPNFCSCMQNCGRRCLPGHDFVFKGYSPSDGPETRGQIFDIQFNGQDTTDSSLDNSNTFWKPSYVTVNSLNQQTLSTELSFINSTEDYQDTNNFALDLSSDFAAISLGLTVEYSNVKSWLRQGSVRIAMTSFSRSNYALVMDPSAPFTQLFNNSLHSLPLNYTAAEKESYEAFLTQYGTHFISKATIGLLVTLKSRVDDCLFQSMSKDDIQIGLQATAEVVTEGGDTSAKGDGKIDFGSTKERSTYCVQTHSKHSLEIYGGIPDALDCSTSSSGELTCNGNWDQYANTRYVNPHFLNLRLSPLSALPGLTTTQRENIIAATKNYVSSLQSQLESVTATSAPEPCKCAGMSVSVNTLVLLVLVGISFFC